MVESLSDVSVSGWRVRISLGIACGDASADAHSVYARADAAMYEAKRAGGMQVVLAGSGSPVS
jgi:GGDEF domain-containing protein